MLCLFQGLANGYVTFVISILFIGACTAVIGDIAGHLGCFINLKDGVNAIAFVALGTSVPGSKKAPILVQKLCWLFFMMSLKVWFLLVSSSTILMFVTLFFLFPSSTNKHMTDVDVTPPSPNACSYLPALLNGSPTFVTSNISFASSSWVMFPATLAASSVLASTQLLFLSLVPVYLVLPVTRRKKQD